MNRDNPNGNQHSTVQISVIVPVFNEEGNILPLYKQLASVMNNLGRSWEVIYVDDGSADETYGRLKLLHSEQNGVCVIHLRRQFGQTAALAAGLAAAQGAIIITIDGDLQNDPADIPLLISKVEQGYDLVTGWRVNRQDPFFSRRLPSKIANTFISLVTGLHLHDYGSPLKAITQELTRELHLYGDMHRFIPALVHSLGGRIIEVPVSHRPRISGTSKYGLGRTLRVLLDVITVKFLSGYSTRPSHFFGLGGLVSLMLGLAINLYLGIERIVFDIPLAGRPLLLLGILTFLGGVQFLTMGLLAELLCRTYHESQQKPIYVVGELLPPEFRNTDRGDGVIEPVPVSLRGR